MLDEHYKNNKLPVECIDVIATAPFALGSLIKYCIRYGDKDSKENEKHKIKYYVELIYGNPYIQQACNDWSYANWELLRLTLPILSAKLSIYTKNVFNFSDLLSNINRSKEL